MAIVKRQKEDDKKKKQSVLDKLNEAAESKKQEVATAAKDAVTKATAGVKKTTPAASASTSTKKSTTNNTTSTTKKPVVNLNLPSMKAAADLPSMKAAADKAGLKPNADGSYLGELKAGAKAAGLDNFYDRYIDNWIKNPTGVSKDMRENGMQSQVAYPQRVNNPVDMPTAMATERAMNGKLSSSEAVNEELRRFVPRQVQQLYEGGNKPSLQELNATVKQTAKDNMRGVWATGADYVQAESPWAYNVQENKTIAAGNAEVWQNGRNKGAWDNYANVPTFMMSTQRINQEYKDAQDRLANEGGQQQIGAWANFMDQDGEGGRFFATEFLNGEAGGDYDRFVELAGQGRYDDMLRRVGEGMGWITPGQQLTEALRKEMANDLLDWHDGYTPAGNQKYLQYSVDKWKSIKESREKYENAMKPVEGDGSYVPKFATYEQAADTRYTGDEADEIDLINDYINNPRFRASYDAGYQAEYNSLNSFSQRGLDMLTEEEKAQFNKKLKADPTGTLAMAFLDDIQSELNERRASVQQDYWQNMATGDLGSAAASYAFGRMTNLAAPVIGAMQAISVMNGNEDANSYLFDTNRANAVVSSEQAKAAGEALNWENPLTGQAIGSDLYGWVTSTLDSIISIKTGAVLGGGAKSKAAQWISQLIMSSGAASNTLKEGLEQGLSGQAAMGKAIASGVIEWATEKFSIEALLKDPASVKKYLLQNMLTEASEEGASNILNTVVDGIISRIDGKQTQIMQEYYGLIDQGMAPQDAYSQVMQGVAQGFKGDLLGGAFSGGLMAGGQAAVSSAVKNAEVRSIRKSAGSRIKSNGMLDSLVELGQSGEKNGEAQTMANRLAEKIKAGKDASIAEIGKLFQAISQEVSAKAQTENAAAAEEYQRTLDNAMNQIVAERLLELDKNLDTRKVADLAKTINEAAAAVREGGKVTDEQAKVLAGSQYGMTQVEAEANTRMQNRMTAATEKLAQLRGMTREQVRTQTQEVAKSAEKAAGRVVNGAGMTNDMSVEIDGEQGKILRMTPDGGVVVETGNGHKMNVSVEALTFKSKGVATLASFVQESSTKFDAQQANMLMRGYKGGNVDAYVGDFMAVWNAGFDGRSMPSAATIDKAIVSDIYNAGKADAQAAESTRRNQLKAAGTGKVTMVEGLTWGQTDSEKRNLRMIEAIAKAAHVDVELFSQEEDENGNMVEGDYANGKIRLNVLSGMNKDGTGKSTILAVAGHELTHFIEQNSGEGYSRLVAYIRSEYERRGMSWDQLVASKAAQYSGVDRLTRQGAISELVAEGCREMLGQSEAIERMAQKDQSLWEQVKGWISGFIKNLRKEFDGIAREHETLGLMREVNGVLQYTNELAKLWDEALVEAVDAASSVQQKIEAEAGTADVAAEGNTLATPTIASVTQATGTDGQPLMSYRSMSEDKDEFRALLKKAGKLTDKEINDLFVVVDQVMDRVLQDRGILDYGEEIGRDDRSFLPLKPNSDALYKVSLDFSSLCRKRLLQQAAKEAIESKYNTVMNREEQIAARNALRVLQERGKQIEVACGLCYVESARLKSAEVIRGFMEDKTFYMRDYFAKKNKAFMKSVDAAGARYIQELGYKAGTKKNGMKADDQAKLVELKQGMYQQYEMSEAEKRIAETAEKLPEEMYKTAAGLWELRAKHPEIFEAYTSRVRNATKSKGIETDTPFYLGDTGLFNSKSVKGMVKATNNLITRMNTENGLRMQSWSDFQAIHTLDYMSAIMELSLRGSKLQTYTKVPGLVNLLGNTGAMINLSLIPQDYNGQRLAYDPVEGMPYETAQALRAKYPNTVGNICIGMSDEHILALLADNDIDYVIPYHASSLAGHAKMQMGLKAWQDYTLTQGEKDADADYANTVHDKNYHKEPRFSDWYSYEKAAALQAAYQMQAPAGDVTYGARKAMQQMAQDYITECHKRGLVEKFPQFADQDGYWKLLIDRKMINQATGEIIKQEAVKPVFDADEIIKILDEEVAKYIQQRQDFDEAVNTLVDLWEKGEIQNTAALENAEDQLAAFRDTIEVENVAENADEGTRRQYAIKNKNGQVIVLTDADIMENKKIVANMSPIIYLEGNPFKKNPDKDFLQMGKEYFESIGGVAYSDIFGHVALNEKGIQHLIGKITYRRTAMLPAIKSVIENGKIIEMQEKHKKHEFDTALMAAVVNLDGKDYYMGVAIKQNELLQNEYYVHDAVLVEMKRRTETPNKSGLGQDGLSTGGNDPTLAIILSELADVKDWGGDSGQKSIRQRGDISVREYLAGLNAEDMGTEAERDLLARYQGRLKDYQTARAAYDSAVEAVKAAGNDGEARTKAEAMQTKTLKELNAAEKRLVQWEQADGFAATMAKGRNMVNNYLNGKTRTDIENAVADLEEQVAAVTKELGEARKVVAKHQGSAVETVARSMFQPGQMKAASRQLKENYGTTISYEEMGNRLAMIWSEVIAGDENAAAHTRKLAEDIIRRRKVGWDEASAIGIWRDNVSKFKLTERQEQELKNLGMTKAELRKRLPGLMDEQNGVPLDVAWQEANSISPGVFDADMAEGDMLNALLNMADNGDTTFDGFSEEEITQEVMANILMAMPAEIIQEGDSGTIKRLRAHILESANADESILHALDVLGNQMQRARAAERTAAARVRGDATTARQVADYYRSIYEAQALESKKAEIEELKAQLKSEATEKFVKAREEYINARETTKKNDMLKRQISRQVNALRRMIEREKPGSLVLEDYKPAAEALIMAFAESESNAAFTAAEAAKVKALYDKLMARDGGIMARIDSDIAEQIEQARELLEQDVMTARAGNGMTATERAAARTTVLENIADIVNVIKHEIETEGTLFVDNKRVATEQLAGKATQEMRARGPRKELAGAAGRTLQAMDKTIRSGNVTPFYFFKQLKNEAINELWQDIRAGQDTYGIRAREMQEKMAEIRAKYHYNSWDMDDKLTFTTKQGRELTLDVETAMQILATWKRETTDKLIKSTHLEDGGFVFGRENQPTEKKGALTYTTNQRSGNKITELDIRTIRDWLTADQKGYMDEVVNYLSTTIGDWGNQVTMEQYGIKKYKEGYYIPMRVAGDALNKGSNEGADPEKKGMQQRPNRLASPKFGKARKQGAMKPLVMDGFTSVAISHMNQMATYSSFALPIENLNSVLNVMVDTDEEDASIQSVRQLFGETYGDVQKTYMENLIRDMNGGTITDPAEGALNSLVSKFKAGAVMWSLSVSLQQPMSYIRAAMVMDPKYLTKALTTKSNGRAYDEAKRWSGVAVIKEIGRVDMGLGRTAEEWLAKDDTKPMQQFAEIAADIKKKDGVRAWNKIKEMIDERGGFINPGKMDEWTWGRIWTACKLEVADTHKELNQHSAEFMELVAERFADVIDATQVYDSTLSRSANMRSQSGLMKMATSFAAEPTLTANMLYDAFSNKENAKKLGARAVGIYLASAVAQALVKGFFTAGRKDDPDKTWMEKYVAGFMSNLANEINPMGLLPFLRDIQSLLEGSEVERTDMSVIAEWVEALDKALNNDNLSAWRKVEELGGATAKFFGLPVKNVMRDLRTMWNTVAGNAQRASSGAVIGETIRNQLMPTVGAVKWDTYEQSSTAYYKRIYDALRAGDTEAAEYYTEYMKLTSSVKDIDKAIASGVKKNLAEDVKAGKVSMDEGIEWLLAKGHYKKRKDAFVYLDGAVDRAAHKDEDDWSYSVMGDLMDAILLKDAGAEEAERANLELNGYTEKQMVSGIKTLIGKRYKAGELTREEADELLRTKGEMDDKDDRYWKLQEWDAADEDSDETYSRFSKLYDAIDAGDRAAFGTASKELQAHGYEAKDVQSKAKSYTGQLFKDGKIDEQAARAQLRAYAGVTDENELYWQLKEWKAVKAHKGEKGYSFKVYDDFAQAVRTGKNLKAVINEYTGHGKSKETLASQITSAFKQEYLGLLKTNKTAAADLQARILTAYELLGYDRQKKLKDISKWSK